MRTPRNDILSPIISNDDIIEELVVEQPKHHEHHGLEHYKLIEYIAKVSSDLVLNSVLF